MTSSWISRTILGLSLSLLLSGCASPNVIQAGLSVWCDTNRPETPTRAQYALFSHEQKVEMADHNAFGAKHCGWRPGK